MVGLTDDLQHGTMLAGKDYCLTWLSRKGALRSVHAEACTKAKTDAATRQGCILLDGLIGKAYRCPGCGWTSWHPFDIEQGYCGHCHAHTRGEPA